MSYYDPTTGNFTTLDPLVALTGEPYGYTGGNPVNGTDPTGMACWGPVCTDGMVEGLDYLGGKVKEGWDATGSKVATYVDDNPDDVLIAVAVGLGIATGFAPTVAGASALTVAAFLATSASIIVDGEGNKAARIIAALALAALAGGVAGAFAEGGLPVAGRIVEKVVLSFDILSNDWSPNNLVSASIGVDVKFGGVLDSFRVEC